MPTVDFFSFCHSGDAKVIHSPGILDKIVRSQGHNFDNVWLIHQNCDWKEYEPFDLDYPVHCVAIDRDEVVDKIIPQPDVMAEENTGPPNSAHYYKKHLCNHVYAMQVSESDYLCFADSDTLVVAGEGSWIDKGIEVLTRRYDALVASPHWGGADGIMGEDQDAWYCRTMSQQIFLINRQRMLEIDWNIPWNWEVKSPGNGLREFYFMCEGRIWRVMNKHNLFRAALKGWRYWHSQSFRLPAPDNEITKEWIKQERRV